MFEKEAEEYRKENLCKKCNNHCREGMCTRAECETKTYKDGAEFGYNKANEWFDGRANIPFPKKAEIYRYTLEVISDKGDIVCYDYKDKNWKKLAIEDEKVTYVPVEVKMWCNKPTKEIE